MKYYYEEEFCHHYRQLMPVVYEKQEDGRYHKSKMACTGANECDLSECRHFSKAPEMLEIKELRDTLIGVHTAHH